MANVYYGDGYTSTTDGNWNTVANWYSTLGSPASCCSCASSGTPLGRAPNATDTVWFAAHQGVAGITTGPTNYAGTVNIDYTSSSPTQFTSVNFFGYLAAGSYSGTVNVKIPVSAVTYFNAIRAGSSFTGTVVRPQSVTSSFVVVANAGCITGGTYAPTGSLTLSGGVLTGTFPIDPGFASGGGTFSLANITVTGGGSDILGAGLP